MDAQVDDDRQRPVAGPAGVEPAPEAPWRVALSSLGEAAVPLWFAVTGIGLGVGGVLAGAPLAGACGAVAGVTFGLFHESRARNYREAVESLRERLRNQRASADETAVELREAVRLLRTEVWELRLAANVDQALNSGPIPVVVPEPVADDQELAGPDEGVESVDVDGPVVAGAAGVEAAEQAAAEEGEVEEGTVAAAAADETAADETAVEEAPAEEAEDVDAKAAPAEAAEVVEAPAAEGADDETSVPAGPVADPDPAGSVDADAGADADGSVPEDGDEEPVTEDEEPETAAEIAARAEQDGAPGTSSREPEFAATQAKIAARAENAPVDDETPVEAEDDAPVTAGNDAPVEAGDDAPIEDEAAAEPEGEPDTRPDARPDVRAEDDGGAEDAAPPAGTGVSGSAATGGARVIDLREAKKARPNKASA